MVYWERVSSVTTAGVTRELLSLSVGKTRTKSMHSTSSQNMVNLCTSYNTGIIAIFFWHLKTIPTEIKLNFIVHKS